MIELFPAIFAAVVLIVLSSVAILFMRLLNWRWWNIRWIKRSSLLLPILGVFFIAVWIAGIFKYQRLVIFMGATLTAATLILILALLFSLPISGVLNITHDLLEKRSKRKEDRRTDNLFDGHQPIPRRAFLKGAAAMVPLMAMGSAVSGTAHAFIDIRVYLRTLHCQGLPPALDGLRILHLSDTHIGYYVWLDDVKRLMDYARRYAPHLIVATGDLSDQVSVYADLLKLLVECNPPLGVYACLGNHEYFRGIDEITRIIEASGVHLLKDRGVTIKAKGKTLYLAGADDPMLMHGRGTEFYRRTVDRAMADSQRDSFSILLSHRPNAFDYAAQAGVDLTLAGHTHGGQVGLAGRSVFEYLEMRKYLWGEYRIGNSLLYTSAGAGHWFPFRLNCPAEAPILELRRA